ncbi:MAG: lipoyl(octanoyl) transferase LipB [Burkholderiales bacterium]|nr:lipoyl(octanoyl) transferase LipB [Burkholderiales bacterium]
MTQVAERVVVKRLGRVDYAAAVAAMREFTARRGPDTPDELWLLEHPPVYTLGQAASDAHGPRAANGIPVVRAERGGEITYHGPGQAVLYTLVDLARRGIAVRRFVRMLEDSVIELIGCGERREGAPGVYVGGAKIAALGIRVSRGCAWHGLALNVDMDLAPFEAIDPCGCPGLRVTQTRDLGIAGGVEELGGRLAAILARRLEDA